MESRSVPASATPMLPLAGQSIVPCETGTVASAYAASLLRSLGALVAQPAHSLDDDAAIAWAESGLMYLIGEAGTPPVQGPGAIPSCARGALQALRALSPAVPAVLDGAKLLSERAAVMGLQRRGRESANRSCRLLAARDGWLAVNLARDNDWALLPAWLECDGAMAGWEALQQQLAKRPLATLVERGRMIGLPVAAAKVSNAEQTAWSRTHCRGVQRDRPPTAQSPLVVDLSSLWAGPLCSHLLQAAGARIIKVESKQRLDGGRVGCAAFYDLLNAGKFSVVLDLSTDMGRSQLRRLLEQADIVIEGSRPRALRQMGIDAEALVRRIPGLTWVSISGYGRTEPEANWVAFGDDAAVAAGVAAACPGAPVFCGDALADPLTGIHAALAALAHWQAGGGVLLDLSLCGVTTHCLHFAAIDAAAPLARQSSGWSMCVSGHSCGVCKPESRIAAGVAATPGKHTRAVLEEFGIPC